MEQTRAPDNHLTEFALKGIEIAAKVFGVAVPPVNLLGILIEAVSERKTKRQFRRLEKLITSLIPRLEQLELEGNLLKPTEPDLLDEILAKAVNDEDEAKTDYYRALIQYCVSGTQDAYQVRLLGDTIKNLTVYEIKAFIHFKKHGALRRDIPDDLRDIFWDRMSTFGLHPRGEKERSECSTAFGGRFLDVCRLADQPTRRVQA